MQMRADQRLDPARQRIVCTREVRIGLMLIRLNILLDPWQIAAVQGELRLCLT